MAPKAHEGTSKEAKPKLKRSEGAEAPVIEWKTASFDECRRTLREWREDQARRPEEVVEIWEHVLSRSPSSLGDELWMVYEQVCIAALDTARFDLSMDCIQALDTRFPRSNRVLKLQAMRYEALEKYDVALDIYNKLIEADPVNNSYRKRRISIELARGNRLSAIKELNEYIKIFINDSEAWIQLSELFLIEQDYARAAHCIEECILAAPLNPHFHRRLADIRYTQGGVENFEIARAYYEQALRLDSKDLRSMYGILLCNSFLFASTKISADKKKDYTTNGLEILQKIVARYQNNNSNFEAEISDLIEGLGKATFK